MCPTTTPHPLFAMNTLRDLYISLKITVVEYASKIGNASHKNKKHIPPSSNIMRAHNLFMHSKSHSTRSINLGSYAE